MDIICYTLMVLCVIFEAWELRSQMETRDQIFQISPFAFLERKRCRFKTTWRWLSDGFSFLESSSFKGFRRFDFSIFSRKMSFWRQLSSKHYFKHEGFLIFSFLPRCYPPSWLFCVTRVSLRGGEADMWCLKWIRSQATHSARDSATLIFIFTVNYLSRISLHFFLRF